MRDRLSWVRRHSTLLIAATVAYVPVVLSSPGAVGADTKTYLYLDPGRVLGNATSLWDSDVALGTVTHQNIGYLWPMGPFYWVFETLGSPDWFAQRMWLATLLFVAGAGVRFLLRTLDWQGGGMLVAVLAYELSPYLLDYSARISAVLLPWAGLPWMIALTIRAARSGGWRHPAQFALVVLTVGSVNATSLLLVGIAPVAWLVHARYGDRSITTRQGLSAALRIALLSVGVSLWWIAGLVLQGGYSLPVTRYTETYQTVAAASTAPEVLRGLGYWFFYGNDKFGPWIEPSVEYTQGVWLLFLSYGLVVLALLGAALVRWRHRSFFVLLIVIGGLVAIGSHPFDAPSPLGSLFKTFTSTDAGLALRSLPRALPMLVLATSVLLATVVNALPRRWPGVGRPFALLVLAAIVLNNPAMWRIRMIEEHLQRGEEIPEYWIEAIDSLDDSGRDGRVWELPGSDFASYRWGNTVDPITPGILERGFVARELVPFGSAESAALLTAFDRRMQEGSMDVDSLVPIARLLSVDDVVHRADLTFERFRTPRPVPTAELLDNRAGLGRGTGFGPAEPNVAGPEQTLRDERHLAIDPDLPDPAPVTVYPVGGALDVVRTRPLTGATVIVGDAEGLVDAAGAGLIDPARPLWFGADLAVDQEQRMAVLAEPAAIVITDGNKRRARRWGTLRENLGYVERAGEARLIDDPTDNRLELFPAVEDQSTVAVDDTRTVSVQPGPFTLRASNYGNPVTYTNDDRPVLAVDGRPETAWVVGAFAEARGEWLEFAFAEMTAIADITLLQTPAEGFNRHITEVTVSGDGETLAVVSLDASSMVAPGQTVILPPHDPVRIYEIELSDLDLPRQPSYPGISPVGFAEVRLGDAAPIVESLRTPIAFVSAVGDDLDNHDLSVVMTRERSDPAEPVRTDPEPEMRRNVVVPGSRTFTVEGAARLSAAVDEATIDTLIGRETGADGSDLVARSSGRLPGDLRSAASFAFDGDLESSWTGEFGAQAGQWVEVERRDGLSFAEVSMEVVVDDAHSVPTVVRVVVDGVSIGAFATGLQLGEASRGRTVQVTLPATGQGQRVRIEVIEAQERPTRDWYSNHFHAMPVAIAEIGIEPNARFPAPRDVDTGCLAVATIEGVAVMARIRGTVGDALDRHELSIAGCEAIDTAAGGFTVQTAGRQVGLDIDQLVLRSPRNLSEPAIAPPVDILEHDDTSYVLAVAESAEPRWLVLGQSHNLGWQATVDGRSLGEPVLIDGFANGWLLPAGPHRDVHLNWTPQRLVSRSIWLSIGFIGVTLGLALRGASSARLLGSGDRADGPEQPTLTALPLLDRPPSMVRGPWVAAAGAAIGTALFAWANLPRLPGLAVVLGLVAMQAIRIRISWARPALAGAVVLGVTSVAIMIAQKRFRYAPDFGWPQQFADLHVFGVLCLLLLATDYVVSVTAPEGPEPPEPIDRL